MPPRDRRSRSKPSPAGAAAGRLAVAALLGALCCCAVALQEAAGAARPALALAATGAEGERLLFGKYLGRTFAEVREVDPKYCEWVLRQQGPATKQGFKDFQSFLRGSQALVEHGTEFDCGSLQPSSGAVEQCQAWNELFRSFHESQDLRREKVIGRRKATTPDFVAPVGRSRPLYLRGAPLAMLPWILSHLDDGTSPFHEEWSEWVLKHDPDIAAEAAVAQLLGVGRTALGRRALDSQDFRVRWEVADVEAACRWASRDKQPEQARELCQRLGLCEQYTEPRSAELGVPSGFSAAPSGRLVLLPVVYCRKGLAIGRWWGTLGAQQCSKEMRAAAFGAGMVMIDSNASAHQLVINRLRRHDVASRTASSLESLYLADRTGAHQEVQHAFGCNASVVKELFLTLLNGGKLDTWAEKHGLAAAAAAGLPTISVFERAAQEALREVIEMPDAQSVHRQLQQIAGGAPPKRTQVFAHVLQHDETDMMEALEKCLRDLGYRVAAHIHDAFGIYREGGEQWLDGLVSASQRASRCLEMQGYRMGFKVEQLVTSS